MSDTNFQPIFDYFDTSLKQQKEEILAELPSKADITKLQNTMDKVLKEYTDDKPEKVVLKAKVERIESWVITAAEETKIPYKP